MITIYDLDINLYHCSSHVSCSKLKTYAELGPYAYHARHIANKNSREDKSHFALGQIIEDLAQGRPFDFDKYIVKPAGTIFNTKPLKAYRDEQLAAGKQFVTEAELRDVRETVTAISNNATAVSLIGSCKPQVTFRREYGGLPGLQARPDWANEYVTVDLKSTADFNGFVRGYEIRKYQYAAQAAIAQYCAGGSEPLESHLLAAEKTFPFRTALIKLPESWLSAGWSWAERHLEALCKNYETGEWPRAEKDVAVLPPYDLTSGSTKEVV